MHSALDAVETGDPDEVELAAGAVAEEAISQIAESLAGATSSIRIRELFALLSFLLALFAILQAHVYSDQSSKHLDRIDSKLDALADKISTCEEKIIGKRLYVVRRAVWLTLEKLFRGTKEPVAQSLARVALTAR